MSMETSCICSNDIFVVFCFFLMSQQKALYLSSEEEIEREENKRYIMQKALSFSSITRCYATLPPKPPSYWRQFSWELDTFVMHLFQYGTCQIKYPAGCWSAARNTLTIVTAASSQTGPNILHFYAAFPHGLCQLLPFLNVSLTSKKRTSWSESSLLVKYGQMNPSYCRRISQYSAKLKYNILWSCSDSCDFIILILINC